MSLVLIPSEVVQKTDIIKNALPNIIENYRNALQLIQDFSGSEELDTETYGKLKSKMLEYHPPIVQGMIAAQDSILEDAETLKQSVGSEELDEDLLKETIKRLENEKQRIRKEISELQTLRSSWLIGWSGSLCNSINGEIVRLQAELQKIQQVLDVVQKKLDTLIEINMSTAGLFNSAIQLLSAVEGAICEAGVEISGVRPVVKMTWRVQLSDYLEKMDEKVRLFIKEALAAELQIDLDELIELYGEDVVERLIEIVSENGIDRFEEGSAEKMIGAVVEELTGYQVTKVNGKYQYVDKEGIPTEFTRENMMNGFELYRYVNNSFEVAQWYVNNMDTYCRMTRADIAANNGKVSTERGSENYICDLQGNLNGCGVYDDCSGLVMATLIQSGYWEIGTEKYNSYAFLPGGDADSKMQEAGFTWHPMSELTGEDLQKGDILVKGGHVEIFYGYNDNNKELALTWGRIYDELPAPVWKKSNINQIYTGIWRIED